MQNLRSYFIQDINDISDFEKKNYLSWHMKELFFIYWSFFLCVCFNLLKITVGFI